VHRFVQLGVTAIPQKTQRKPQKTQSVVLSLPRLDTERSRSEHTRNAANTQRIQN